MGSMTLLGAGKKAAAGVTPATFHANSATQFASSTPTISLPGTPAVGDVFLMLVNNSGTASISPTMGGGGALTALVSDHIFFNYWSLFSRTINSADVSTPNVAFTNADTVGGVLMAIYRGATVGTLGNTFEDSNVTSLAVPGFAPSGSSKGVVCLSMERTDAKSGTLSATSWAAQTNRDITYFRGYTMDRLSGYTNASVTFSGYDNTLGASSYKIAYLVDLT